MILQVWLQQCYCEISCEENGDIDFKSLCLMSFLVVKSIQVNLIQWDFWWFQWFSDFRSWDGLWLDYRCALAKTLLELLDTEGCISCSRMLRPCHGCLDQGFDPFEGNGTTRHLGKLWWWCHCFHVVSGPNSIPMQMKFHLLICQSQEEINTDDLFCLCKSFWRL